MEKFPFVPMRKTRPYAKIYAELDKRPRIKFTEDKTNEKTDNDVVFIAPIFDSGPVHTKSRFQHQRKICFFVKH